MLLGMFSDPGIPKSVIDLHVRLKYDKSSFTLNELSKFKELQKNKNYDNFREWKHTETDPETRIETKYYCCKKCDLKVKYEERANLEHCDLCQVCIMDLDHHCVFFGKCIGKGNIYYFYGAIGLFLANFFLIMTSTMRAM